MSWSTRALCVAQNSRQCTNHPPCTPGNVNNNSRPCYIDIIHAPFHRNWQGRIPDARESSPVAHQQRYWRSDGSCADTLNRAQRRSDSRWIRVLGWTPSLKGVIRAQYIRLQCMFRHRRYPRFEWIGGRVCWRCVATR